MVTTGPRPASRSQARSTHRASGNRHFLGPGTRARDTPQSLRAFETALVADLRAAADCYPADQSLRRLVAELRAGSDRFAELWDSGAVGRHEAARKIIDLLTVLGTQALVG
ncbi:hypothetical protein ACIODS_31075 [Micromonospora chalcea]|uniref:MmyB family transcriptional regulator n=1 Tax=Micromonospora chalcea TaxID=1874 RepID=UPI00380B84A8